MAIDPVCNMNVEPEKAAGKAEHEGATYYFCSVGCQKAFVAEPEKYVEASGASSEPGKPTHPRY